MISNFFLIHLILDRSCSAGCLMGPGHHGALVVSHWLWHAPSVRCFEALPALFPKIMSKTWYFCYLTFILFILTLSVGSSSIENEIPSTTPTVAPPSIDSTFEKSNANSEFGGSRAAFRWIFSDSAFNFKGCQINSHGTRRLYPPGTRWQCTVKTFYYGVCDAYRLKLTWVMYF